MTLDAIAEKVSPKRVASRTGKKVTTAVKGSAESVKDGALAVKDKVTGGSDASAPVADTLSASVPKKDSVIALPPVALAGIAAALIAVFVIRRRRR